MDNLNSGYLQLGLFALAFGGLQVCWIASTIHKRDLARPMSEGDSRRASRAWEEPKGFRTEESSTKRPKPHPCRDSDDSGEITERCGEILTYDHEDYAMH